MSALVFMALYRPKPGKENELRDILKVHIPVLREEGLITERELLTLQAEDGTIIEIAEWKSSEAIDKAHQSDKVMSVWNQIGALAELTNLSSLAEAQYPFPNFKAI
ncbi:antibiotic biosynthesis monooxygenase [Neobacillus sp. CF12]|uniref:antibiotic biosynthesis monooxygenase n=1 Tax=Neobacillus sp. CF12 TaxID=3055864 RepID=UPI0025A0281C|nr:antibiotic biosynthesis monooxygenase [Neobacillus sp. CF12]MDM5327355.1 antibiotic biosynthesis monooxygenase [Neobacillus sp. CF12]